MSYFQTFNAKLIYIFSIHDAEHSGCVKVGETTLSEASDITSLAPNSTALNQAARKRIDQYTKTAAIHYTLHHTELCASIHNGKLVTFDDKQVHRILLRSGVKRKDFSFRNQGREWFVCSIETALKAIAAAKEGRNALDADEVVPIHDIIEFRPEQQMAIDKTVNKFVEGGKVMLWNAKMRFGKTLSALQVVKLCGYHRTIIVTHRPVVDKGWFEDFAKIFKKGDGYRYGSREKGFTFKELEDAAKSDAGAHYVYFASMQDLRGAQLAGGKFDKNAAIFSAPYDLIIVDEAHEGTQTELGQNVITLLCKKETRILNLSGTPFNLLDDYKSDEIYTWDYVMEQKAKEEWEINHFGDPNPYAGLPRLNIFTFDLGNVMNGFDDEVDYAFNFKEFFRVWTGEIGKDHKEMPQGMLGRFVHEEHVKSFLDLIVKYDETSNYPFSTGEYRNSFRHTLWMVPGVKAAQALSKLLQSHPIFGQFNIVNVAGEGDEDVPDDDALKLVERAIGDNPEDSRTITLSCGKLTTGVSVKPWTAVLMLSGSHNTDAKAYMQTIFRVQTPYTTKNGKRKENCYVFDFAPDRTLKVLADTAKVSTKTTPTDSERVYLGEFLNFCPVIGYNGTHMSTFNVERMLESLKKAYISRITKNGCDDPRLYNMEMLRTLDKDALSKFQGLHRIIGSTKASHSATDVDMAQNGLTNEEYEEVEKIKKKPKRELTEEEKRKLEEAKQKKQNADAAISILRGISIRLPLMMYGADLKDDGKDVTLDNFVDLIDDQSWEEFMPRGVTKQIFKEFTPYYDPDIFRAVGRNYRDLVRAADKLTPTDRTKAVAQIFSYFRNPDKETVLTPWRVVNMHMSDCLGGYDFFDDKEHTIDALDPKLVHQADVTENVFADPNTKILEINSKTGLYPLYVAYSTFRYAKQRYVNAGMSSRDLTLEEQQEIWDKVLQNNIFVICKTTMARSITKRTLTGFRNVKQLHLHAYDDLINQVQNKKDTFIKGILKPGFWNLKENKEMLKFSAIVGNPPYQQMTIGHGAQATAIYPYFIEIARELSPMYISMITPSRWLNNTGIGIDTKWVEKMFSSSHFIKIVDFLDASKCFPRVEIKGGVNYFLYSKDYNGLCHYVLNQDSQVIEKKISLNNPFGIIIRDSLAADIIEKIDLIEHGKLSENNFSQLIGPLHFFDNEEFLGTNWDDYSKEKSECNNIKCYVNKQMDSTGYGWIDISKVPRNKESIGINKVYIPKAGGSGNDPYVIGTPFLGEPNSVCSFTYICIGYHPELHNFSMDVCENIIKYMKTRFFRYMVSIKKKTQDCSRGVFQFAPMQDFSHVWTDEMLYKKYKLSSDEIKYIEGKIKPMK